MTEGFPEVDWTNPVCRGLVLLWRYDNGAPLLRNSVTRVNGGTTPDGKTGCPVTNTIAASLTASKEAIFGDVPSNYFSDNGPFTVHMLCRYDESTAALDNCFQLDPTSSLRVAIGYFWNSGNGFIARQGATNTHSSALTSGTNPTDGDWHFITVRQDTGQSRPRIYVDGVRRDTGPSSALSIAAENAIVLNSNFYSAQGAQSHAFVGIWNRNLTEPEILSMHSREGLESMLVQADDKLYSIVPLAAGVGYRPLLTLGVGA